MQPKISIIVPVYMVEQYLEKCIDSILLQTFTDFELILVNDGSPDNCRSICDSYAMKDQRIKVIHKENGGPSSARNAGIEIACGEYIGFVDSDDYIHERMYEILFDIASKNLSDIVVCDYYKVKNSETHEDGLNPGYTETKGFVNYTNLQVLNLLIDSNLGTFIVAWNKLYRSSLFNYLKYIEGRVYEDLFLAHKIIHKCTKITYTPFKLYYYLQREGSIVNSQYTVEKFDKLYAMKDRANFFRNIKEYQLYEEAIRQYTEVFFWNYYKAKQELPHIRDELNLLKKTMDESILLIMKNKLISWKQKIMILLFVINPSLHEFCKKASENN
ncbi:glycosyltransferase family 2 protein [Virgibacillus sp. L01]|uniref:glycosyltransferase family 2 protein n=1 Tax=Virgibacillus sp. L01 TaxID=3457429 RepID=UPI003FD0E1FD